MKTFLDLAKERYSVRSYAEKPVEEDKLNYVLEAGRVAPSAANHQPWHIIVIRDEHNRQKLAEAYHRKWFYKAPVILAICGDHTASWKRADNKDHCDIDISIIVDHLTLAAAEQGLGTCWICNFEPEACSRILELPDHIEPIVLLPLGYPGEEPDDRSRHLVRKTMKEIIHFEKF